MGSKNSKKSKSIYPQRDSPFVGTSFKKINVSSHLDIDITLVI